MDSIWSKTCNIDGRKPLTGDIQTEVAVIGAGMAGILTALALQEAGVQTVVLEADRIAGGQTRNTTAKLTAQHGKIYDKLIWTLGKDRAKQYAQANMTAIQEYKNLISSHHIACDLEERDAYVYGECEEELRREVQAACELGFEADFVASPSLPFKTAGAVRFSKQAQFHPLKLIRAVSDMLTIYEHTKVLEVKDDKLITSGGTVLAKQIVFACHFPFVNFPGMYFARMHQERSYFLALENAPFPEGMWICADDGGYSFRNYNGMLFMGGENHRTGENSQGGRYERLRQKAKTWFPQSREVACWSAQDCITVDGVPYIGRYAASHPNWYVATGFGKWGMSTSMVLAMILRDMICKVENPYAGVFDPGRFSMQSLSEFAVEGGQAVKGLTKRFFDIPSETLTSIPAGHGEVVMYNGEKVGVYKEEDGIIHAVDICCPHLGASWSGIQMSSAGTVLVTDHALTDMAI